MSGDGVLFQSLADDLFREAVGVCVGLQMHLIGSVDMAASLYLCP
jgi:hypothetical protein